MKNKQKDKDRIIELLRFKIRACGLLVVLAERYEALKLYGDDYWALEKIKAIQEFDRERQKQK